MQGGQLNIYLTFAEFVSLCNGKQFDRLQRIMSFIIYYNLHIMTIRGWYLYLLAQAGSQTFVVQARTAVVCNRVIRRQGYNLWVTL